MTRSDALSHAEPAVASAPSDRRILGLAALGLALLTLLLFGDLLFASGDRVASHLEGDTGRYFIWFRQFGFGEIARGNLPLWNPYVFSGAPFLAGFQSALLYPPNLLYLVLPLALAINLDFALHVFLAGLFGFAWVRARGLHPFAAFFSAVVLVCGSAFSLRVLAGQLTLVAAMVWAPLLLLAVDRIFERPRLGWILMGILATTLQILSGYPACVYATGVAVGLYAALRLLGCVDRKRVAAALAVVALAPLFLSAAQLWPGLEAVAETVRGGGVSYDFATSFSLPPENLITLFAPGFFGDILSLVYWGRWYYWDAVCFIGVVGLVLALHGGMQGSADQKRFAGLMVVLLVVISLGRYTPIYRLLYAVVPGLDAVRAPSKFLFQASLFAALLAGIGVDRLLASARGVRASALVAVVAAVLLGLAAIWVTQSWADRDGLGFGRLVDSMAAVENRRPGKWMVFPERMAPQAAEFAAGGLWLAAGIALVTAALLVARRRVRFAAHLMLILGVAELVAFAATYRGSFSPSGMRWPALEFHFKHLDSDERYFYPFAGNRLLPSRVASVWGYDPVLLRRYAELMAETQPAKRDAIEYTMRLPMKFHPIFAMLRCGFVVEETSIDATPRHSAGLTVKRRPKRIELLPMAEPLPRYLLVREYRVTESGEETLAALLDPSFDPRRIVLLEREPDPPPRPGHDQARIELLDESTDHLSLEIELDAAAILLITDAYSEGWRARGLAPGPQERYEVLPANHALRAIPLAAGHHRLRVEYAPLSFRVGRAVSLGSGGLFLAAVGWWVQRRRSAVRQDEDAG